jgi:hypothetical protein
MARRDLAGLAALGALGMMMSKKKGADRDTDTGVDVKPSSAQSSVSDTRDYGVDYSEAPQRGMDFMTEKEPGWESGTAPARLSPRSTSPRNVNYSNEGRSSVAEKTSSNPDYGNEGRRQTRPASDVSSSKDTKTYRDLSGNIKTKSADGGAAERAANREKALENIKGAASSFGDYMSDFGKREEKHGTYVKDGKVVRYAKGGMTSSKMMSAPKASSASKRADGIATKGKTKGTMIMCGGGMAKGKK